MRNNRVIYFDGRPSLYQDCLSALFSAGVDLETSVAMLDTFPLVPDEEAQFFLSKLWAGIKGVASSISGGARKAATGKVAKAIGGAAGKVAGKVKDAAEKADKKLGNVGGGDEECEWITIHGPAGTTRICIDHEGKIAKGPKGIRGTDARKTLGDHESIGPAQEKAKAKREEYHKREKAAGSRIAEWADKVMDVAEVAMDPGAAAVGLLVGKVVGEKVGAVKKVTNKLKKKLVDRYGDKGAAAIILAGMAAAKGVDLVLPGVGSAVTALPGGNLVAAMPVAAAVEGVREAGKEAKRLGQAVSTVIKHLTAGPEESKASPAERAKKRKKKRKAAFASEEAPWQGGLSDEEVEELGSKWWREHVDLVREELSRDQEAWHAISRAHKKASKKAKSKKAGPKKPSRADR